MQYWIIGLSAGLAICCMLIGVCIGKCVERKKALKVVNGIFMKDHEGKTILHVQFEHGRSIQVHGVLPEPVNMKSGKLDDSGLDSHLL